MVIPIVEKEREAWGKFKASAQAYAKTANEDERKELKPKISKALDAYEKLHAKRVAEEGSAKAS